ncbi:glycosyltransferase, partial [Roseibium sp. RKSG952]|uniref:glycosyltransferase n=1 Tax=Roseibium sp. RKSG952 TaxID=2529384 RepID=UPI0018AD2E13
MPDYLTIAFFVPWITQSRGGTENVGQMMANAMAERGHVVHIFTFDGEKRPSVWPLAETIKIRHLSTGDEDQNDSEMLLALASVSPDLIVGLHLNRTLLRYVKCARKLDIPVVLSEHIDPRFPERAGTFSREERLMAFHGATGVHLLVDDFLKDLPSFLRTKVSIIPNTVPEAKTLASASGKAEGFKLITVARLIARKNIDRLIKEFASISDDLPDWTLEILGDGPQKAELLSLARKLGIANRVNFVGEVSNPYDYLSQAHIFVLPSLFEGFPMSSLEAMAHGLPVVGYQACNGINVQVVNDLNGFLVQDSFKFGALAEKLRVLMSDGELRDKMGQKSLEFYHKKYSHKIVTEKWENLFFKSVKEYTTPQRPDTEMILTTLLDRE